MASKEVSVDFNVKRNFEEFIRTQVCSSAKNTTYANSTAGNAFSRFFKGRGESREPDTLPACDLDSLIIVTRKEVSFSYDYGLIATFFIDAKKLDGKDYEPDSLSTLFRSLQRYLHNKKYPFNILVDSEFVVSYTPVAVLGRGTDRGVWTKKMKNTHPYIHIFCKTTHFYGQFLQNDPFLVHF